MGLSTWVPFQRRICLDHSISFSSIKIVDRLYSHNARDPHLSTKRISSWYFDELVQGKAQLTSVFGNAVRGHKQLFIGCEWYITSLGLPPNMYVQHLSIPIKIDFLPLNFPSDKLEYLTTTTIICWKWEGKCITILPTKRKLFNSLYGRGEGIVLPAYADRFRSTKKPMLCLNA